MWNVEQRDAVLDAAAQHNPRLAAAFELVLLHGLRRNEFLGLRWQDVDLQVGKVHIRQQLGGGPPKTGSSRRSFRLDEGTVASLRAHRKMQLQERLRAEGAWQADHDLVFTRPDGSPLTPKQFARAWDVVSRKAGVPYISLHGGRHTAITLGLAGGVPLKVMSERAGHASTRITADLYAHVLDEHDEAAAALIGSLRTRRHEEVAGS